MRAGKSSTAVAVALGDGAPMRADLGASFQTAAMDSRTISRSATTAMAAIGSFFFRRCLHSRVGRP
jgi:hypothetical protein